MSGEKLHLYWLHWVILWKAHLLLYHRPNEDEWTILWCKDVHLSQRLLQWLSLLSSRWKRPFLFGIRQCWETHQLWETKEEYRETHDCHWYGFSSTQRSYYSWYLHRWAFKIWVIKSQHEFYALQLSLHSFHLAPNEREKPPVDSFLQAKETRSYSHWPS